MDSVPAHRPAAFGRALGIVVALALSVQRVVVHCSRRRQLGLTRKSHLPPQCSTTPKSSRRAWIARESGLVEQLSKMTSIGALKGPRASPIGRSGYPLRIESQGRLRHHVATTSIATFGAPPPCPSTYRETNAGIIPTCFSAVRHLELRLVVCAKSATENALFATRTCARRRWCTSVTSATLGPTAAAALSAAITASLMRTTVRNARA